jgi:hypothetical protein
MDPAGVPFGASCSECVFRRPAAPALTRLT